MFFGRHLRQVPVIAILRGLPEQTTVDLAHACWDAGIELVEVPAQGAPGLRALEATAAAARERGTVVGAGTVYTVEDAARAREAGAAFLVAPGLDEDTVEYAAANGVPYLPGVMTPTEMQRAASLGVGFVKLFPAGSLGPEFLAALRGPFPEMNFVAVGGVSSHNAQTFLDSGAVAVGVGGALADAQEVRALAALTAPHQPHTSHHQMNQTGGDK
jgi:Entner-Doudoroff aldolase